MKLLKKNTALILIFSTLCLVFSCERDDICAEDTPTTPFMIIRFIDDITKSDAKPVNSLKINAVGSTDSIFYQSAVDSILIPLRTDASITDFIFTINSKITNEAAEGKKPNADELSFQYTASEEYLSSACGFRATFKGLTESLTQETETETNWIKGIDIIQKEIINEKTTHVLIYH